MLTDSNVSPPVAPVCPPINSVLRLDSRNWKSYPQTDRVSWCLEIYLVPASSWRQYDSQKAIPAPLVLARRSGVFEERRLIFIYPTDSPDILGDRPCGRTALTGRHFTRTPVFAAREYPVSFRLSVQSQRGKATIWGKVSLAGCLVRLPPWRRSILGHTYHIRKCPLPSAGEVRHKRSAVIGHKSLLKK